MARDFAIRNPQQLLKNMVTIRDILAKHGIQCWLHYGTCLGAIREHNFIAHDDDADMGIYGKDYEKFMSVLPELEAAGLKNIPDEDWNGRMFQFVNTTDNGEPTSEQVDIFYENEIRFLHFIRRWDLGGRITVPYRFLSELDTIDFLGEKFNIPSDAPGLMRKLYGKTWNVPIANAPSKNGIRYQLKKLTHTPPLYLPKKLLFYIRRYMSKMFRLNKAAKDYKLKDKNKLDE